jgi:hypothetical protein
MAQTAVDFLVKEFNELLDTEQFIPNWLLEQAKSKEKEQIIDAFDSGLAYDYDESETYYNKTYNNGL